MTTLNKEQNEFNDLETGKFRVVWVSNNGEKVLDKMRFKTMEEAQTYIGIERTQFENADEVLETHIVVEEGGEDD